MPNQLEALERTIAAGQAKLDAEQDALIALCRLLADQLDSDPAASTRLTAAYLSALKDLGRVLNDDQRGKGGIANPLASVRDLRSVPAPSKKRADRSA